MGGFVTELNSKGGGASREQFNERTRFEVHTFFDNGKQILVVLVGRLTTAGPSLLLLPR